MDKKELINSGKVKSVFTTDNPDEVIIEFRDDMTAGDGERKEVMNNKGAYNAVISTKIFRVLEENGVETQLIDLPQPNVMLAKKLEMIPIEVIVRNIAAGSFAKRYGVEEGCIFDEPVIEISYKNDDLGDPLMNDYHAKALKLVLPEELDMIKHYAFEINKLLKEFWEKCDIILVDFKLEFGRLPDGTIILADEISPDTSRLWDVDNNHVDKDVYRRDLGDLIPIYQRVLTDLQTEFEGK